MQLQISRILIFGATGVIGQSCLRTFPKNAELVGFTYFNNKELANNIKNNFPKAIAFDMHDIHNSYEKIIQETKPSLIVNALAGMEGFNVSMLTAKYKINLALANKESMVMAGWWLKEIYQKNKLFLAIIDSEHTSIKMLIKNKQKAIKSLFLTCSGGPYYKLNKKQRDQILCPENGLTHPTWKMGPKITFDSATLFNKAFEMIEAYYLFDNKNIFALYHPQSLVHALVTWTDETISLLASSKNMDFATGYVLNGNQHPNHPFVESLDFRNLAFQFKNICERKWPPIKWANQVIKNNNRALAIILVVLDDYLYELFTKQKINFGEIYQICQLFIDKFKNNQINTIDDVMNFYYFLEKEIRKFINEYKKI